MPAHPERCPKCGALTWNWFHLSARIQVSCEHCGFEGSVSNVPTAGVQAYRG